MQSGKKVRPNKNQMNLYTPLETGLRISHLGGSSGNNAPYTSTTKQWGPIVSESLNDVREAMAVTAREGPITSEPREIPTTEFQSIMLRVHNELRSNHDAPDLILSLELCQLAQAWAEKMAEQGILMYRGFEYGENMYSTYKKKSYLIEAREAVSCWYSEIKKYRGTEDPDPKTSHFTQMVWKSTKELGVGRAYERKTGKVYIISYYSPIGNIPGEFYLNVKA